MSIKLYEFHGGMGLVGHKSESLTQGLKQASLPEQLFLPLKQHIGDTNKPVGGVGEQVLGNQLLAGSSSPICAPIHAPTSGTISAIGRFPIPHPSGQADSCIVIDVDGLDESIIDESAPNDEMTTPELISRIRRAGIVGLGGAAFPTSPKLSRGNNVGIETLIINGAECEPYITCDDMLMQTYASDIICGIAYLQRIFDPKQTLIGIEDDKPKAIKSVLEALESNKLGKTQVVTIPTIYPSGGEKQLVRILTGKEIPKGKLAFDTGLYCQNVGTCAAIARALDQNLPLTSRIVTLSGDGVQQPGNWETRLGTPISHLIELAGGYKNANRGSKYLVMGGPMMGFSLINDAVPVIKATNNILVMQRPAMPQTPGYHSECIRCAQCAEVCPAQLMPQQLYWQSRAKNYDRCEEYHLSSCIECGCCSAVCPSQIPLVQYYRAAKSEIRVAKQTLFKSDRARIRFEFREKRLLLKKQQDEERKRLKREALKKKHPKIAGNIRALDPVQAALERVKAKKLAQPVEPKNTTNLTPAQLNKIEEADARRRAAREQHP